METVDLCLARILPVIDSLGGMAIITADHGNADEMYEVKKGQIKYNEDGSPKAKTSHTLNPVPCHFYDNTANKEQYTVKDGLFGLSNIAATVADLLGVEKYPGWDASMIQ